MLLEVTGDLIDKHDRMPDLVGIEDIWRQAVAAPVPDTPVGVNAYTVHDVGTGNFSGSVSTERSALVKTSCTPVGIS